MKRNRNQKIRRRINQLGTFIYRDKYIKCIYIQIQINSKHIYVPCCVIHSRYICRMKKRKKKKPFC